MAVVAALVVVVVATGATVAAVAGPAPDGPGPAVGEGVARVADAPPRTVPSPEDPVTTVAPTTIAPAPEGADNADLAPTDCATPRCAARSCRLTIAATWACAARSGPTGDCADGEMCGDIPAPTCADPTMCGDIVPEPVPDGG